MSPGDLVIFLADPLLFGGELRVIEITDDMQILCEPVHWDDSDEPENAAPPRALFDPHEIELADWWARSAA